MNTAEAQAWAAGLFLADGTVGIHRNNHSGRTFYRVHFKVAMQEHDVVERFHQIVENPNKLRSYKPKKSKRMWASEMAACDDVLRVGGWMHPLMVGKKADQMGVVMLFCEDVRRLKGYDLSDEQWRHRRELYEAYLRAGAETK